MEFVGKVYLPYHWPMATPRRNSQFMTTLTVTSKGQVTLRGDVLRHLGIGKGEKLEVNKLPGGRLEIRAARSGGGVERVCGILESGGRRATLEEIHAAAAAGWAGRR